MAVNVYKVNHTTTHFRTARLAPTSTLKSQNSHIVNSELRQQQMHMIGEMLNTGNPHWEKFIEGANHIHKYKKRQTSEISANLCYINCFFQFLVQAL
jgi:hypothetical protein